MTYNYDAYVALKTTKVSGYKMVFKCHEMPEMPLNVIYLCLMLLNISYQIILNH